jgi:LysM repeat protein
MIFLSIVIFAQPAEKKLSREEYIQKWKDEAVREMLTNGIPASIKLAQALLESGDGNSPLAKYANNHFGIKCHVGWDGETFIQDDDEKNECFRKYYSSIDSYRDHSRFLKTRPWYQPLFSIAITDYKAWAYGLKKAGYATHPKYPQLLIDIIEKYKLYEFDIITEMPMIAGTENVNSVLEQNRKNANKRRPLQIQETSVKKTFDYSKNEIDYVIADHGDTYEKIARENEMGLWQIISYNDFSKEKALKQGMIVYLQPKRNKTHTDIHIVKSGESLHDISQMYGIKMKKIIKRNRIEETSKLQIGQKIYLNHKAPKN